MNGSKSKTKKRQPPSTEEFAEKHKLHITYEATGRNPWWTGGKECDHWKVTLHSRESGGQFSLFISKARDDHGKPPTIGEVLYALAEECFQVDNTDGWLAWVEEYRLHALAKNPEKCAAIYARAVSQRDQLETFLGPKNYQCLLKTKRR